MQKPEPKKASDLKHPKAQVRAWNGDLRPARSDRWNGATDMEDQGFDARRKARGLSVTEGTRPPSGVKSKKAPPLSRALTDKGPDLYPLKSHQEQMLSQRQRHQNRRKGK